MRHLIVCIVTILATNISSAMADDNIDFVQQTKGWEWLFTEKSDIQKVSYPVETDYRVFENHPDYRVRGRFIYDKTGNLKRVSYLLSTYYEKWNLNNMLVDYNHALDTLVYYELREYLLSMVTHIAFPKKCIFKLKNEWGNDYWTIFTSADYQEITLKELDSPNDNPIPQCLIAKVGVILKENGTLLTQKKLKEVERAVELASQDTSVVTLYMVENGVLLLIV